MSAFGGVQGYETLTSARQQDRRIAQGLARNPSKTPEHLTRVLYISPHGNQEFEMFVHDISAEYHQTISQSPLGGSDIIGAAQMGSLLYRTRLGTMKRPTSDLSSTARYFVKARFDADLQPKLSLQKRVTPGESSEATV
ncbi:hypothetical protein HRG_008231 [Hirsutella rhossiliensis]|uniref:Uncharacterized protein n=1 Tax=Hirsutella rhossiliensis TaxID=111463 RepID=A0A9P8MRU2_9HYPO|nr:uncharacterized protein HRG_08231 [Hirsutella rhossiliensis]KAH0961078.1 hypothetical protein HRG_08231 [Hirsutella rhossiliensis]